MSLGPICLDSPPQRFFLKTLWPPQLPIYRNPTSKSTKLTRRKRKTEGRGLPFTEHLSCTRVPIGQQGSNCIPWALSRMVETIPVRVFLEAAEEEQLGPVTTSDSGKDWQGRRKKQCDWQVRWEPTQELVDWEQQGTHCALPLLACPLFITARTENHCPPSSRSPLLLSNHDTKSSLCGG